MAVNPYTLFRWFEKPTIYKVLLKHVQYVIFRHAVNTTYMDVGSADIAGENICHPCRLDGSILATDSLKTTYCKYIYSDEYNPNLIILQNTYEQTHPQRPVQPGRLHRDAQ